MLSEDGAGGNGEKQHEKPAGERNHGDGQKCCRSTFPLCAITAGFLFTVALVQMETLSNLHYVLSFPIKPLWPFSCMTVSYFFLLCKASLCKRQCIPSSGSWPGAGMPFPRDVVSGLSPGPHPSHISLLRPPQLSSKFPFLSAAQDSTRNQHGRAWQEGCGTVCLVDTLYKDGLDFHTFHPCRSPGSKASSSFVHEAMWMVV